MPYGCFIEFPHHLSGLAPTKYLTNEFVSGPDGLYHETQTVWSKVQTVDEANGKLTLSLRPSDLTSELNDEETMEQRLTLFREFLTERNMILKDGSNKLLAALDKAFVPGCNVEGVVSSVDKDVVFVKLYNGVVGVASIHSAQGSVETGDEVMATVVDLDLVEHGLVLSLRPELQLPSPPANTRVLRSASKKRYVNLLCIYRAWHQQ